MNYLKYFGRVVFASPYYRLCQMTNYQPKNMGRTGYAALLSLFILAAQSVHAMTRDDCYADVNERLRNCLASAEDEEGRRQCYKTSNEERRECKDYSLENSNDRFQPTPIPQRPTYILPGVR